MLSQWQDGNFRKKKNPLFLEDDFKFPEELVFFYFILLPGSWMAAYIINSSLKCQLIRVDPGHRIPTK